MSKRIGKFTTVSVDDSGNTARDITNDVTSLGGVPLTYEEIEVGGYGQDKYYLAGRADNSITLEGFFNPTATTGSHTVLSGIDGSNTARTVTIGYGSNATPTGGDPEFEGEFICTEYTVTPDLNGAMMFSAKFMPGSSTLPAWGTV